MSLAISSTKYTADGLREFAFDLKEKLKTVPGLTNIAIIGGNSRQINVSLNPEELAAKNININDVVQAIQGNNFRLVSGNLEGENQYIPVEVDGNIPNGKTLSRLIVGGTPDQPVYLEDVAMVDDGHQLIENHVTFAPKIEGSNHSGNPKSETENPGELNAVYLSFAKAKSANISDVTADTLKSLESLKKNFIPSDIQLTVTRDEGATAREEIMMLTEHLTLAILIVTITLVFFLGWRAALVVATAIPLTLALVFIVGYFFGQTINRITLFALIFSLGLLVDDAIVVVENIYRHFSLKNEEKTEAIAHATGEVGMGVLLSTITAVVVFVPMGLVTGMMGAYMGPIAFFAPVARLASLFVAYTLSPYLSSIFLKEHHQHQLKEGKISLEERYRKLISKILDSRKIQNRILAAMLVLILVTFSFPILEIVHFRMLPKADKEQFYIYLDGPESTPLEKMNQLASIVEQETLKNNNVLSVESYVGAAPVIDFNGLFRGSDMRKLPNQATLKVNLLPPHDRHLKSEEIVIELRPKIQKLHRDHLFCPLYLLGSKVRIL
jgi:multidrug efflux pump subunit AcrB